MTVELVYSHALSIELGTRLISFMRSLTLWLVIMSWRSQLLYHSIELVTRLIS